ncbi:MAG: hypothetical protein JWN48_1481 [Myxococcaceae bacterium]|nr:hypothetical protein [Myxococcaceae bacterium]
MAMSTLEPDCVSKPAIHVGCRAITTLDSVQGATLPIWLLYPTRQAPAHQRFGPYELTLAMDAEPEGQALPLVLISHGTGGTPWAYRELAIFLAQAGFVLALIEHPGNNRNDNSLAFTRANLENRPRHVSLAIDAAVADSLVGPRIAQQRTGLIGHSLGGYTALAVAGGRPSSLPQDTPGGQALPLAVARDRRVRALVLLAPATPWYMAEGSLREVDLPILMRTGELDDVTPAVHAQIVAQGLRDASLLDHRVVPGAGHFAFLSPFPASLSRPGFAPAQDPIGFDRAAFHRTLYPELAAFLRAQLGALTA